MLAKCKCLDSLPNCFIRIGLIVILFFPIVGVFGQNQHFKIEIHQISIEDTFALRGLSADFPNPVMSVITVKNQNQHYVHGLANNQKWIGPDDKTDSGDLVNDIWHVIEEKHLNNPSYPNNQNVKQMIPNFLVTEAKSVSGFGVSIGLAMDYSGSMGSGIDSAEDAARILVREITSHDKIGIVKITNIASVFQEFTADTTLLMKAIKAKPPNRLGTALNIGIQRTLELCQNQTGRKVVVVYTDGLNDMAGPTAEEIVAYANEHNITIFTIGLGNQIEEDDLKYIAEMTNGYYVRTPNADKIAAIYKGIYNYIQGYYVLAHTTTDPFHNGTWRKVNVTLKQRAVQGSAWGKYYVPFVAPNVSVNKTVFSDSTVVSNGDTLYFADAGDTVTYQIQLKNTGPSMAGDIWMTDSLAQYLDPFLIYTEPEVLSDDSIKWRVPKLAPGEEILITYQAIVSREMPKTVTELLNHVRVDCPFDFDPEDNHDEAVLYAVGYPDFIVSCHPLEKKASPGYPLKLEASLANIGTSHSVVPVDVAFYFEEEGSNPVYTIESPSIAANDTTEIGYIWPNPQPGTYHLKIVADYKNTISELDETNNQDTCTVQVAIDSVWIQVSDISYQDSVFYVQGGFPENILTSVNVLDQNWNPVPGLGETQQWLALSETNQQGLSMESIWQKLVETHLDNPQEPENANVLPSLKVLERDATPFNCAMIIDFSTSMAPWQEVLPTLANVMDDEQTQDWTWIVGLRDNVEVLVQGTQNSEEVLQAFSEVSFTTQKRSIYDGIYQGIELVSSQGGRDGVIMVISGPDNGSVQDENTVIQLAHEMGVPIYFLILNPSFATRSFHQIANQTGGLSIEIHHPSDFVQGVNLIERFFRRFYILNYTTPDTVQNQTWREVDVGVSALGFSDDDKGFYLAPLGRVDLGIQKEAIGSFTIGQFNWGIQPGDTLCYQLSVKNLGHHPVYDVQITDQLPDGLLLDSISVLPSLITESQLMWQVDSVGVGETLQIIYNCFMDTMDYQDITPLVNMVVLEAAQDTIPENNIAQDTTWYYPLLPADLVVWKEGVGDSLAVSGRDSIWYTYPGDTIQYTVQIANQGEQVCRTVTVQDILPDYVTLIALPEKTTVRGDTLFWQIDFLNSRGDFQLFHYTCRVDTSMPPWEVPLINVITVKSQDDTLWDNNTYIDTVWAGVVMPPGPQIRISPQLIEPGDSIQVQVMTPVFARTWDLQVIYGDGTIENIYADEFIDVTDLTPNVWTTVLPPFDDTWMREGTHAEERTYIVLETTDYWNSIRTDTASFLIQSSNKFVLDRNVFRPAQDDFIQLNYKLSTNRDAKIIIYDLAGGFVREVVRGPRLAGWNSCIWDGTNEQGCRMGSGVYLAVILSGSYHKSLKFMIVR